MKTHKITKWDITCMICHLQPNHVKFSKTKNRSITINSRKIAPHTYHIQQIIMSIVKMLIEVFLFIKPFSTVSTFPFIYIYTDLVLFLISVKVIV